MHRCVRVWIPSSLRVFVTGCLLDTDTGILKCMVSDCHVPSVPPPPPPARADPFDSLNWRDTTGMLIMFCKVRGISAAVIYARGMAGDCDSYQCGRVHGRQAVSGSGWQ